MLSDDEVSYLNYEFPKIYAITDVLISGVSHAEQVKRLIDGGIKLIQLRDKHASPREFYFAAKDAIEIAREHGVKIIINDRVDIAIGSGADGVHLGQNDLPPTEARKILGPDAIIGYSTHSVEQARAATGLPVDYFAVGPIFETATKEDTEAAVGLAVIGLVKQVIGSMPVVAIGGINDGNLATILDAGADSVAMIGALVSDAGRITENAQILNSQVNAIS